jgi:hypothetical protein
MAGFHGIYRGFEPRPAHQTLLPDRAPAFRRAARARKRPDVFAEVVIHRQLLARFNDAQAHVQHMPLHDAAHQIGIAAMVDDLGAAAAHRPVQGPVTVHGKQVGVIAVAAVFGFLPVQALAGVLNDLALGRNPLTGENSVAMDFGPPDHQLETGALWIELGRRNEISSHVESLILANRLQSAGLLGGGLLGLMFVPKSADP